MGKVIIDRELCKGCSLCVDVCPKKVLKIDDKANKKGFYPAKQDDDSCTGCSFCALMCPEVAIEVYR